MISTFPFHIYTCVASMCNKKRKTLIFELVAQLLGTESGAATVKIVAMKDIRPYSWLEIPNRKELFIIASALSAKN